MTIHLNEVLIMSQQTEDKDKASKGKSSGSKSGSKKKK
jgi:hypothetical protein